MTTPPAHEPLHEPFIPASANVPEFTWRAVILGVVLGMVFGASSLYLVLKVGITVSASIPVAVIALALFRIVAKSGGRDSTILENNIVQTAGSAGESIAFGLGVTMPAILILGFDLDISRVMLVAVLGALLGILMMIPLRSRLIVQRHGELKFPEGTACAAVLTAAEASKGNDATGSGKAQSDNGQGAAIIFWGFAIGLVYKTVNIALKGWKEVCGVTFGAPMKGASLATEISPELLGVGYIIGPRIAAIMAAGGVLSYMLLIPLIKFFGDSLNEPLAPGAKLIRDMTSGEVRGAYLLYIGAGAVAAGGIISLVRALPTLWHSLRSGLAGFKGSAAGAAKAQTRTERDIPMRWVLVGWVLILTAVTLAAPLHMNILGALLILMFGFLFSTVSAELTGEIGSSSNPISGMTVATLLFTCLIFLLVGWTGGPYYVTALSVGAIVCIASSNAGTTAQDLKTGFLVGATPRLQQYAILLGALSSALMLGPILLQLNDTSTVYVPVAEVAPGLHTEPARLTDRASLHGPQAASDAASYRVWHKTDLEGGPAGKYLVDDTGAAVYLVDPGINGAHTTRPDGSTVRKYDAPKAVLMSYIIKGILDQQLPWALVLFGVMIAVVLEMSGISALPFAVGVYLPISTSAPVFIGGAVRWWVDRAQRKANPDWSTEKLNEAGDRSSGVLLASGYIAGGALAGILIAFSAGVLDNFDNALTVWATANNPFFEGPRSDLLSLVPYAALVLLLGFVARRSRS